MQRLASGVGRSFQVAQVFEALTVLGNVQLALQAREQQEAAAEAATPGREVGVRLA